MVKESVKRMCICKSEEKQIIHIDTIELTNHELESVDGLYCVSCNSFWREP